MTDKEKVIKGLEICFTPQRNCKECPYDALGLVPNCTKALGKDALALLKEQQEQIEKLIEESASNAEIAEGMRELLKEQEPVKPAIQHGTHYCGNCGRHLKTIGLNIRDNYCGNCGRRVKWDDEQTEND